MIEELKALGSDETRYTFDFPHADVLERFPNPMPDMLGDTPSGTYYGQVKIVCPEFTSLCPKTGQPDFATIIIEYRPQDWCVESKSLKLYLMGFRNHGSFHEKCVAKIADDLIQLLQPFALTVEGQFTPRGGIPFWPRVVYIK